MKVDFPSEILSVTDSEEGMVDAIRTFKLIPRIDQSFELMAVSGKDDSTRCEIYRNGILSQELTSDERDPTYHVWRRILPPTSTK